MNNTALDDVFSDKPIEPVAEVVAEPVAESTVEPVVETPVEAEASAEAVVETPEAAPTAAEAPKDETVAFKQAMLDERGKRQDLEKQLQALKTPEVKPDAYSQPEEALDFAVNKVRTEMSNNFRAMQENAVRAANPDYDEKFEQFEALAAKSPALLIQLGTEFDPAAFVYKTAVDHEKLEAVGDLGTFEERIRAEERAKVQAEFETDGKAQVEKAINDAIPQSLSNATAAAGTAGAKFAGKTPLNKIFPTH